MTVSGLGGAVSTEAQDNATDIKQLIIFELAGGSYGLDIQSVREINRLIDVTPIPKAPEFVEGIINLRGTIIPVVDLAMRFGLEATARSKDTRIVVIESDGHTLGMKVDEVSEVLRIKTDEIDEAIERPGADLLVPVWRTETARFGEQDSSRWEGFTKWMQENGLLSEDVEAGEAFTNRFAGGE